MLTLEEEDKLWLETYYHYLRAGYSVEDSAGNAGNAVLLYRQSRVSITKKWSEEIGRPTPPNSCS